MDSGAAETTLWMRHAQDHFQLIWPRHEQQGAVANDQGLLLLVLRSPAQTWCPRRPRRIRARRAGPFSEAQALRQRVGVLRSGGTMVRQRATHPAWDTCSLWPRRLQGRRSTHCCSRSTVQLDTRCGPIAIAAPSRALAFFHLA
eukprot:1258139-Amphidinium_carterae.1